MTLYLQMNGTSDYLVTPSVTIDTIILDMSVIDQISWRYYFKNASNYNFYLAFNNTKEVWPTTVSTYLNAVLQNPSTSSKFPRSQRMTIKTVRSSPQTDIYNFFKENTSSFISANVWDIKLYNGATLVAHYDMSTGTVQDVSGNGNHATLTGGTWVDDGAGGGTPTTLTVSLSDSVTLSELIMKSPSKRLSDALTIGEVFSKQGNLNKSDSITLSDKLSKNLTVTVVDSVSMGDTSTSSQGGKSASLSDTVIVTDAIVKKVISTYKNDAVNLSDVDSHTATQQLLDSITSADSITVSNGKSIILSDTITVTDAIFKAVNVLKSDSITLADSTSKTAKIGVYDVLITSDDLSILNPQAPAIIGTIHLKGEATLNIYLVGSQTLNVSLKGGI